MVPVIEQFYCEGCKLWLTEGGTVHDAHEHFDGTTPHVRETRYSYDGGATWEDEEREPREPNTPTPNP